jgi:SAM-dependent methyltransferase
MSSTATISDLNLAVWNQSFWAFSYRRLDTLLPAETAIFDELAPELGNAALLDLGVGTGRTTEQLAKRCRGYVGVDYSAAMTARACERFPGLDLRTMDARDLSAFADGAFDIVLFSHNGIDYVGHEDRLLILQEIHRVLKPGGAFVFSTHNRDSKIAAAHDLSNLPLTAHPLKLGRNIIRYGHGILNARQMKPREQHLPGHALINDSANHYSMLTYYIHRADQVRQLAGIGFTTAGVFDNDGKRLDIATGTDPRYMLHYLARRG